MKYNSEQLSDRAVICEVSQRVRKLRDRYEFRVRIQGGIGGLDFA